MIVSKTDRENSVLSIARVAVRAGRLHHFYTPLYLAKWETLARRSSWAGICVARLLGYFFWAAKVQRGLPSCGA